jgi:hypothetical protein
MITRQLMVLHTTLARSIFRPTWFWQRAIEPYSKTARASVL